MPELPEVETVRRGLEGFLVGKQIQDVHIFQNKLRWEIPASFKRDLTGQSVVQINRRGKYLCWLLTNKLCVVSHLGMSGSFSIYAKELGREFTKESLSNHDHVLFKISENSVLLYNDPRRFGSFDLTHCDALGAYPPLATLGVEPLGNEFNSNDLYKILQRKNTTIKVALLDQSIIAGVGNIYASEALWKSGISPKRKASRISMSSVQKLVEAIRLVLREAISSGGSTLRNYRTLSGNLGYFQHHFNVYDKENCPCPRADCDSIIARIMLGGRSTFYCKKCQR